jgi:small-conductance mechanosensitive channel
MILPSMPGYESLAFKGIATFLGALLTIGGSSVIANYMAGLVITYMHAFEKGDWVEIDGASGQVISVDAFSVSLKSYKKETVKIPNSKVLSTAIYNYSLENQEGSIIYTEISIGYDVHWKKVNDLLIQAAMATPFIKDPWTHYKKLDDFYVVYELNASINDPGKKPEAYSSLHRNILDLFHNAGVEIMSPHYRAERDGSTTTVSTLEKSDHDKNS